MRYAMIGLALLLGACGYGGAYAPPQPSWSVTTADAYACEAQAQQAAAASMSAGMINSIIAEQNVRNACLRAAHERTVATQPAQPTDAEMRANWCAALRRSGQVPKPGEC